MKKIILLFLVLTAHTVAFAVTYPNLRFVVELVDAAGNIIPTTSSSPHTICVGSKLYVRNKSIYGCSGGGGITGSGLAGTIDIITSTGAVLKSGFSVVTSSGGNWGYNEILEVPMHAPTGGTSTRYIQVKYWESTPTEVTFTTACGAGVDPTEDFLCYGRIMALPTLTTSASPSTICKGQPTILSASGAATYSWTPGGATTSSITVYPGVTTVYTVIGTNGYGCTSSKTITVNVNPNPAVVLPDYSLCDMSHMPVLNAGNAGSTYVWTWNGGTAGYTQYMNTAMYGFGTYAVTVTSPMGCSTTSSCAVALDPSANPNALFSATHTAGTNVYFSVSGAVSNTNNSWELWPCDAFGTTTGAMIEGISYLGSGNSYSFSTAVTNGQYYRINHIVSSNPCLVTGSSYGIYFPSTRGLEIIMENGTAPSGSIEFLSYPNPASNVINIQPTYSPNGEPVKFTLFDTQGRKIGEDMLINSGEIFQFDISRYSPGIYLLKGTCGSTIVAKKIVKQ